MEFLLQMKVDVTNPGELTIAKVIDIREGDNLISKICEAYGDELKNDAIIDVDGGGLIRRRFYCDSSSGHIIDVLDLPAVSKPCWGVSFSSDGSQFYMAYVHADSEEEVRGIIERKINLPDVKIMAVRKIDRPYSLIGVCGGIELNRRCESVG